MRCLILVHFYPDDGRFRHAFGSILFASRFRLEIQIWLLSGTRSTLNLPGLAEPAKQLLFVFFCNWLCRHGLLRHHFVASDPSLCFFDLWAAKALSSPNDFRHSIQTKSDRVYASFFTLLSIATSKRYGLLASFNRHIRNKRLYFIGSSETIVLICGRDLSLRATKGSYLQITLSKSIIKPWSHDRGPRLVLFVFATAKVSHTRSVPLASNRQNKDNFSATIMLWGFGREWSARNTSSQLWVSSAKSP